MLDADQTAREVVMPGTPGLKAVTEAFGEEILNPDGTLNRKQLARWFLLMREAPTSEPHSSSIHHRATG